MAGDGAGSGPTPPRVRRSLNGTIRTAARAGVRTSLQRTSGCKRMKKSATSTFAALLAAAVYMHGSCLASENNANGGTGNILGALAGSAVPTPELGRPHARRTTNIHV